MPGELYFEGPPSVHIGNVEGNVYIGAPGTALPPSTVRPPDALPPKTPVVPSLLSPGLPVDLLPSVPMEPGITPPVIPGPVRCKADVRQCPDGSFVARRGPDCSFAPCPTDSGGGVSDALNELLLNARRYMVEGVLEQYLAGVATGALIFSGVSRIEESKKAVTELSRELSTMGPVVATPAPSVPPSVAVIEFILGSVPPETSAQRFRSSHAGSFPIIPQPDPTKVFLSVSPGRENEVMDMVISASSDPLVGAEVALSFQNA